MLIRINKTQPMAKYLYSFILLSVFTFGSCQTMQELPIDYMLPADISFPSELKRVAIVNNISSTPDNKLIPTDNQKKPNEISRATVYHDGNAATTTQSLAEAIAKENYFDEVIICDSALRAQDITPRESMLSQEEVQDLTDKLGVDFIISLENLQMKAVRVIRHLPEWACFQGTIDLKVYPTVKIYLPSRKGPMVTVNSKDSIFWEELGTTESYVRSHLAGDSKMLDEASEFAGIVPVKHILPYWKTSKRYLYTNGSVHMRDATIYAREKSWDKAFNLWEQAYRQSKKSPKLKMAAAHNIAVYYEMQDSIAEAETWAIKAQEQARKVENIDEKDQENLDFNRIPNYVMITLYIEELKVRKDGLAKLNIQMSRFNDDF